MTTATATEVQNNFGRFLKMVIEGQEVVDAIKQGDKMTKVVVKDVE